MYARKSTRPINFNHPALSETKPEKPLILDDEALINLGITGLRRVIAVALQSRTHDIIMNVAKGIYALFLGGVTIC